MLVVLLSHLFCSAIQFLQLNLVPCCFQLDTSPCAIGTVLLVVLPSTSIHVAAQDNVIKLRQVVGGSSWGYTGFYLALGYLPKSYITNLCKQLSCDQVLYTCRPCIQEEAVFQSQTLAQRSARHSAPGNYCYCIHTKVASLRVPPSEYAAGFNR